jgi:hypothetical protein
MLSPKFIQLIEDHWESIATSAVQRIRQDPELLHLRDLADSELLELGQEHLRNLGHWLVSREDEIARHSEGLGRLRYRELVPLHEAVRGLQILKACMLEFLRRQEVRNSIELYAEEELEYRAGQFFDGVVYHLVKGYEMAAQHAHASA